MWPNMHFDVKKWRNECLDCQQSKIPYHVKNNPAQFIPPDSRFKHIHLDIIGPLPEVKGYQYCLILIDRFSRWTEAVPLKEVLRAFFDN